jgi:hypothetical protein
VPTFAATGSQQGRKGMLRLRTWAFRYALLAAFVLAAGAGIKW